MAPFRPYLGSCISLQLPKVELLAVSPRRGLGSPNKSSVHSITPSRPTLYFLAPGASASRNQEALLLFPNAARHLWSPSSGPSEFPPPQAFVDFRHGTPTPFELRKGLMACPSSSFKSIL